MAYGFLDYTFIKLLKRRVNKIKGLGNVPQNRNFILVANHHANGDSMFIIASLLPILKQKIYFLSKEKVCKMYGKYLSENFFGMIPVKKDNKLECLEIAQQKLLDNKIVGIFPEGRIDKERKLVKAKTGVARLALKTRIPILPVGYIGPKENKLGIIPFLRTVFNKQGIEINIGKPLTFEEYYNLEIDKNILDKVTRKIMQAVGSLIGEDYKY